MQLVVFVAVESCGAHPEFVSRTFRHQISRREPAYPYRCRLLSGRPRRIDGHAHILDNVAGRRFDHPHIAFPDRAGVQRDPRGRGSGLSGSG